MNDPEIQSILEDAGYSYDPVSEQFFARTESEEAVYELEEVAGELEIPVDDLMRWQEEQAQADL
jgi:RecJ-like exonuclease